VNTKIEEDINKKDFNIGAITAKEFRQGFVWFKLPDSEEKEERVMKIVLKKNGKLAEYSLPIKKP
jgi:hypothetical protein